jgi:The GLUG motif
MLGEFAMALKSKRDLTKHPLLLGGATAAIVLAAAPVSAATVVIKTLAQLQNIEKNLAGNYELGADIDASASKNWNGGAGFIPIGAKGLTPAQYLPFTGKFNGAGHKINHLTFGTAGTWIYTGLFAYVGATGQVENLTLQDARVTSTYQGFNQGQADTGYIATLAGVNAGKIVNVKATGVVTLDGYQNVVAGLVGYNQGLVESASSAVAVTGNSINSNANLFVAAGLVGINVVNGKAIGTISKSSATGKVVGGIANGGSQGGGYAGGLVGLNEGVIETASSAQPVSCSGCYVGGLVGYNETATGVISGSKSSSAVTSSINGRIGGLVGYNAAKATVKTSSASGSATSTGGNTNVGGLVGENDGTIETSHATSKVAGIKGASSFADTSALGGLVGANDDDGVIKTSYATGNIADNLSPGVSIGGLVGFNNGPGSIDECYATGNVTGTGVQSALGGLVGTNTFSHGYGLVENSYAHGNITGGVESDLGELIGFNDTGTLKSSYGTGKLKGGKKASIGGDIGSNQGKASTTYWDITATLLTNGAGSGSQTGMSYKGEAELKSATLPAGFSSKIWKAKKGAYPYLSAVPQAGS